MMLIILMFVAIVMALKAEVLPKQTPLNTEQSELAKHVHCRQLSKKECDLDT